MPNNWIIAEVERLAGLAWPEHAERLHVVGSSVGFRKPRIFPGRPRGTKAVMVYGDPERVLAIGPSFRQIAADLKRMLELKGIDHQKRGRGSE